MEEFKNSYLAGCTDYCKIEDVFSCPNIGESNNKEYTKISNDVFKIKDGEMEWTFRCDENKSYLTKFKNGHNPEGSQEYTDENDLAEIYGQLHDWYNSYKDENMEKKSNSHENDKYDSSQDNNQSGSISKNEALKLAQAEGGTYDEELETNILYRYDGICYHEDCFCTYKDKPSYIFTVKLENTERVIGYICVYNDGSLVEWCNPKDNW